MIEICRAPLVAKVALAFVAVAVLMTGAPHALAKTETPGRSVEGIIAQVASDIPGPTVTQTSRKRPLSVFMQQAQVPGVSVAVFIDGRLAWSKAWGVRTQGQPAPVTPATMFQAASISKPVTALAAMTLVADGRLALDRDVGHAIDGWAASQSITLRQLLSHTAGLNVSGFEGYSSLAAVPSPLQVLRGDAPSKTPPVVVESTPGVSFNYSGGGYTVVQMIVAQAGGRSFAETMAERVLKPLKMTESTFDQPLAVSLRDRAASGHRDGEAITGGSNTYPELAAAGLWTTPSNLGRVAVDIQNAQRGLAAVVATPAIAREMLTPQIGGYGLGFELKTREGEQIFEHSGLNEGFEARLVASASATGPRYVVVVMTNGRGGTAIADGVIRAVARQYGWKAFAPRSIREVSLSSARLAALTGFYRSAGASIGIEQRDKLLHVRDDGWRPARMIAVSPSHFVVEDRPGVYQFGVNAKTGARTLRIVDGGSSVTFARAQQLIGQSYAGRAFLRGTMNDWQMSIPLRSTAPGTLEATIALPAGRHEFKIGDAEWREINLGARLGQGPTALAEPITLSPMGGNLSFETASNGRFRFSVDTAQAQNPKLTVTRVAE